MNAEVFFRGSQQFNVEVSSNQIGGLYVGGRVRDSHRVVTEDRSGDFEAATSDGGVLDERGNTCTMVTEPL